MRLRDKLRYELSCIGESERSRSADLVAWVAFRLMLGEEAADVAPLIEARIADPSGINPTGDLRSLVELAAAS